MAASNGHLPFEKEIYEITDSNAVVRHIVKIESETGDGKPGGAYVSILQVWQKQGGNWKILARQAVPVKPA